MADSIASPFPEDFLIALRTFVNVHHSIYPIIPPQGIYSESLVEASFRQVKKPFTLVGTTSRNQPTHDLLVENCRISLKTETGFGTRLNRINITKLCTTEKEPWTPESLLTRALSHLDRYDEILMLRAIWDKPLIHYQLVAIPIALLKQMKEASFSPVGHRKGRQSIAGDVEKNGVVLFHVHFDGADGKCQIRNLDRAYCSTLLEWDFQYFR
jgi:hypothetical protein